MSFPAELGLLIAAILVFCSILISKAGYRFGIPNGSVELEPGDVFLVITDKTGKVHI